MRQRVTDFIAQHDLLRAGSSVVAGVSGGADSVALLHTLWSLAPCNGASPVCGASQPRHPRRRGGCRTKNLCAACVSFTACRFTAAMQMCHPSRTAAGKRWNRPGGMRGMVFWRRRAAILARM